MSALQNPYAATTKIAKSDDGREHSWAICGERAEKSFLQLIWISFPLFLSLDPPKGTFRCVWLSRKMGNTESFWSWKQYMTQVSNCLATRAWQSSSSQLSALPSHPVRTLGLEILDIARLFAWIPVRFQVTYPWQTLGLHVIQLSFAFSAPHLQSLPPGWQCLVPTI